MDSKLFKSGVSFFNLGVVRNTFYIFSAVIIVVTITILVGEGRSVCFKAICFEELSTLLKVPFALLAVLASILALYAMHHRSVEAQASMELTKLQNNFSNYYKHLDEFEKYVKQNLIKNFPEVECHVRSLFGTLFPKSRSGEYRVNFEVVKIFRESYENFFKIYFKQLELDEFSMELLFQMYDIRHHCIHFGGCFMSSGGADIFEIGRHNVGDPPYLHFPTPTLQEFVNQSLRFYGGCNQLMQFDAHYDVGIYVNAARDFYRTTRQHRNYEKYRTATYKEMNRPSWHR